MESPLTIGKPSFSLSILESREGDRTATDGAAVAAGGLQSVANASACDSQLQLIADGSRSGCAVRQYAEASLAVASKRAYANDLAHFLAWGDTIPTTPGLVARYLAEHGGHLSPFTLGRRLVAIGKAHTSQGFDNPCDTEPVRAVLRGIRRVHGTAQRRVDPLLREDLLAVVDSLPDTTKGKRDRALLLVGFGAALRRSELVALTVEDVRFVPEGVIVRLRRSKTDQEAAGRNVGIPNGRTRACPVKALRAWLDHAGITNGPIFRSVAKGGRIQSDAMTAQSVALIVKHHAAAVGLDPDRFSGHSLRAGLITSAAKLGVSAHKLRQQSGHRSETMLARYIRDGELFASNAAGAVL